MHVEADVTTEKEQRKGSFVYFSYYLESENAFSDCSEMGGTFDGGGGGSCAEIRRWNRRMEMDGTAEGLKGPSQSLLRRCIFTSEASKTDSLFNRCWKQRNVEMRKTDGWMLGPRSRKHE